MSGRKTDVHQVQELVRLCREGLGDRAIARTLRMGRDTVRGYRKALRKAGLLQGSPSDLPELEVLKAALAVWLPSSAAPQQCSSVEPWRERVEKLWTGGAGPTAIFDRLRVDDRDFPGSLSAIKRLCLSLKRERGVRPEDVAIPVETEPGEVAYVDFGYAGLRYDPSRGVLRKSWVFVMVLGHSRHMVAYLVFDQKVETWIRLHVRAFKDLGGVPRVIVPDNLKAAVLRAAFGIDQDPLVQRSYRELARHYGFRIEPTRPRTPEHKGKVEAGVKYVKRNFLAAHESIDLVQDQTALEVWLREVASRRCHGTTRRRPAEVFESEERAALLPLPQAPYQLVVWKKVKLHRDSHVQVDGAFYSAPWRFLHQDLWARCTAEHVTLYHDEERVADHRRVHRGGRATLEHHLPEHRVDLRHRSRTYWETRAIKLGPQSHELVRRIFDSDDVLTRLRVVQAVVTLLEAHPQPRAEATSRRALYFGCLDYAGVKGILRQALDLEPLPSPTPTAWSKNARFARTPSELGLFAQGER